MREITKQAIDINSNTISSLNAIGAIHYRLGNFEEAIEAYKSVGSIDKDNESHKYAIREIHIKASQEAFKDPFNLVTKKPLVDIELQKLNKLYQHENRRYRLL